ncbi:MAG: hypothetical protein AMJ76_03260, partial [Dehalococcoidia bacterium SM23_28_1]
MRKVIADTLATAPVVALALLGFWAIGQQENALAQGSPLVMGIDPETTGNTCGPSPADCTLGTIEPCYEVACPSAECTWDGSSTFDDASDYVIDVYIDDPEGSAPAPIEYNTWVFYDQSIVHIADPATDGKIKMPGADTGGADEHALPDSDGAFMGFWMFLLATPDPGGNTYIGDGPLLRLGLDMGASGVVTFSLESVGSGYSSPGPTSHPLTFRSARLAINDSCAIASAGGIAQLPPLPDRPAPNYA